MFFELASREQAPTTQIRESATYSGSQYDPNPSAQRDCLTDKRIRRGVFRSVPELVQATKDYVQHHSDNAKGFCLDRTTKAEPILETVRRARPVLDKIPSE
jgi:hypothetical protein